MRCAWPIEGTTNATVVHGRTENEQASKESVVVKQEYHDMRDDNSSDTCSRRCHSKGETAFLVGRSTHTVQPVMGCIQDCLRYLRRDKKALTSLSTKTRLTVTEKRLSKYRVFIRTRPMSNLVATIKHLFPVFINVYIHTYSVTQDKFS